METFSASMELQRIKHFNMTQVHTRGPLIALLFCHSSVIHIGARRINATKRIEEGREQVVFVPPVLTGGWIFAAKLRIEVNTLTKRGAVCK